MLNVLTWDPVQADNSLSKSNLEKMQDPFDSFLMPSIVGRTWQSLFMAVLNNLMSMFVNKPFQDLCVLELVLWEITMVWYLLSLQ